MKRMLAPIVAGAAFAAALVAVQLRVSPEAVERRLNDDVARPVVIHGRQAGCWQSWVKNYGIQMNSIYNAARLEDVWIDKPNG